MKSIAIIGAGITGLTAAIYLSASTVAALTQAMNPINFRGDETN